MPTLVSAGAQEQRVQSFRGNGSTYPNPNDHGQRIADILQDSQHLVASTIADLVVHEFHAPDIVRMG